MERPSAFRPPRANDHGAVETARRRRREHRNHAGLARDLDVEPVLTRYAGTRFQLGRGINSALFPNRLGDDLFRNLSAARIRDRALVVAAILETYRLPLSDGRIVAAGDLARQAGEAIRLRERAELLRGHASAHVAGVLLPWLLPAAATAGVVTLADGPVVDAAALAEALASLPERGVALPALPELLVTVERVHHGPFTPDDPAIGNLLAEARDARHVGEWLPTRPLPDTGIHLGRIGGQLRHATCTDRAVVAGLRELADFVRQQVRGDLRARQAAAAAAERDELAAEAHALAALLRQQYGDRSVPTTDVATTLLAGIRILTNALAWDAHFDDRAVALRTGDLRPDQSVWDAWANAASIDSAATDTAMRTFLAATNSVRRRDHGDRGLLLRPDNSRLTVTRVFDEHHGADVVARFKATGSCWFEIPVESLPHDDHGSPRYFEAVAAGVSVHLVAARCSHRLEVRHSGSGWMRLIEDGRVVEQPLSPETVSIDMRGGTNGTFGIVPTPEAPAFPLAGRAIAAAWSLRLLDGDADLDGLTAIEVQIDLEAFVPADAATLGRISHPAGAMVPGATATATVELTAPAPAGGLAVALASTHPEIVEPTDVVVPAGARSAQFDVVVHAPTGANRVVLTARTHDGASIRFVPDIPAPGAGERATPPDDVDDVDDVAVVTRTEWR
jgi:hypothetical protein